MSWDLELRRAVPRIGSKISCMSWPFTWSHAYDKDLVIPRTRHLDKDLRFCRPVPTPIKKLGAIYAIRSWTDPKSFRRRNLLWNLVFTSDLRLLDSTPHSVTYGCSGPLPHSGLFASIMASKVCSRNVHLFTWREQFNSIRLFSLEKQDARHGCNIN